MSASASASEEGCDVGPTPSSRGRLGLRGLQAGTADSIGVGGWTVRRLARLRHWAAAGVAMALMRIDGVLKRESPGAGELRVCC